MTKVSIPKPPKAKKQSKTGGVLSFLKGKKKNQPEIKVSAPVLKQPQQPPPQTQTPPTTTTTDDKPKVTIGTNRGKTPPKTPPQTPPQQQPQTPPTQPKVDPLQGVKDRIAALRKEVVLITTYEFTAPKGVTDKLQLADDAMKKATQPEQLAGVLNTLSQGAAFAAPVKSYYETRLNALNAIQQVDELPNAKHPALVTLVADVDKTLGIADQQVATSVVPEAVQSHTKVLQHLIDTLAPQAVKASGDLTDAEVKIKEAEAALAELSDYKFLNLSAAEGKIKSARTKYDNAKTIPEAATAADELKGYKDDLKSAKSDGKKQLEASEKYYSKRRSLMDELAEAMKLRGADTDPAMKKLISGVKDTVGVADVMAGDAKTTNDLEVAERMLAKESGIFDKCEKLAKKLKEKAEADIKAIPKYEIAYLALRDARAKIATLPGATAQLQQCDVLLAEHRIATNGEPAKGYVEALQAIDGKAASLLEAAEKASQKFASEEMHPDVQAELEKANAKIEVYGKLLPVYRTEGRKLAVAAAASDPDKDSAVRRLQELLVSMDQEILGADQLKQDAMAKTKTTYAAIKKLEEELKKQNAPAAMYEVLEKTYNERVLPAMSSREFDVAIPILTSIEKDATEFLDKFAKDFGTWSTAKQRLDAIAKRALEVSNWPPLAGTAKSIRDDIQDLITTTNRELTYLASANKLPSFEDRLIKLEQAVKDQNLGDDVRIEDFATVRSNFRQGLEGEKNKADLVLGELEKKLAKAGIKSVKATPAHKIVTDAYAAWLEALNHPVLKPGEDPKKILQQHFAKAVNELQRATQLATTMQNDDNAFQDAVKEGGAADHRGEVRAMFNDIHRMLNELEAMGINVSKDRAVIAPKLADSDITKDLEEALKKQHAMVKFSYDREIGKLEERREESRKQLKGLKKSVKKHSDHHFEDYFNELDAQIEDAEAMLEAQDPTLVAAAEQEIAALYKALDDTEGDKNDPNKKTFSDVVARWKELSGLLGKDEKMKKRMNFTYTMLRDELNKAIGAAKKLPPNEALAKLQEVGVKIEKAAEATVVQDELFKKFEAKFKELRTDLARSPIDIIKKPGEFKDDVLRTDKITEVKKRTQTRITEKTTAFWDKIDTALSEAEETAKTEGHIHEAMGMLAVIEKELDDLLALSPDDARVALQEKDGEAAQEQRVLRDMCRQWEREVEYFMNKVLPETEKVMSKNKNADMTQIDDMRKAVEWATNSLEPYLFVISALPHRSVPANKSPDMKKATNAFGQARKKLDDMVRTANRLAGNPEGTNIDFEGDLKKVNAEWGDRAERLIDALDVLAKEIEAVPGQSDTDQNKPETYLDTEDKKKLVKTAANLAKSLRDMGNRIKPNAFEKPMAVLTNKKATAEQKLTAREEALRIMRLIKTDVADNKLIQALFHTKDNPFRDIRPEVGLVRAGLKKIEIEVLVGV